MNDGDAKCAAVVNAHLNLIVAVLHHHYAAEAFAGVLVDNRHDLDRPPVVVTSN